MSEPFHFTLLPNPSPPLSTSDGLLSFTCAFILSSMFVWIDLPAQGSSAECLRMRDKVWPHHRPPRARSMRKVIVYTVRSDVQLHKNWFFKITVFHPCSLCLSVSVECPTESVKILSTLLQGLLRYQMRCINASYHCMTLGVFSSSARCIGGAGSARECVELQGVGSGSNG